MFKKCGFVLLALLLLVQSSCLAASYQHAECDFYVYEIKDYLQYKGNPRYDVYYKCIYCGKIANLQDTIDDRLNLLRGRNDCRHRNGHYYEMISSDEEVYDVVTSD